MNGIPEPAQRGKPLFDANLTAPKTILLVGGTGMLGRPVAQRMKRDGFQVRIFTRNPEAARTLFDPSFEIFKGNVENLSVLENAMEGCWGVHINLSGEIEQIGTENTVKAALKTGISRISYVSGTTVSEENSWFFYVKRKLLAENSIRGSGIPHTIFRPTWFMESIPNFVKRGKAFYFGRRPQPFHLLAAEDFARMVSKSYMIKEAENRTFHILGPEPMLITDALQKYCRAIHPEIKRITVLPFWLAKVLAFLTRNREMKFAVKLMEYFERTGEIGDPTEANRILGKPSTTFEEWLERLKRSLV